MTVVDENKTLIQRGFEIQLPKEYFISQEEVFEDEPVRILSCNRSGTIFLQELIKPYIGRTVPYTHWNMFCLMSKCPMIISPIRDPYAVYTSLFSLDHFGNDFFRVWNIFNEAYEKGIIKHILPVDIPERREKDIEELSDVLGEHIYHCLLKTEWEPVNVHQTLEAPRIHLGAIYDLPVVKKFYPNGQPEQ